jgi:metallophosphoesterase superfamily enzyme
MTSIEARLAELLDEYQPRQLIILGDLVHDAASATAASELLVRLRQRCEVTALTGNHDRHVEPTIDFVPRFLIPDFLFRTVIAPPRQTASGSLASSGRDNWDGKGLRLKCPALIQQEHCWILPAFSPWAGGVSWPDDGECRIWLCTPGRVLRL